jgi:hypothetical protein
MAFRIARPVWIVWACLAGGTAVPVLLAVAAHRWARRGYTSSDASVIPSNRNVVR